LCLAVGWWYTIQRYCHEKDFHANYTDSVNSSSGRSACRHVSSLKIMSSVPTTSQQRTAATNCPNPKSLSRQVSLRTKVTSAIWLLRQLNPVTCHFVQQNPSKISLDRFRTKMHFHGISLFQHSTPSLRPAPIPYNDTSLLSVLYRTAGYKNTRAFTVPRGLGRRVALNTHSHLAPRLKKE
jgi:hypothetical protein